MRQISIASALLLTAATAAYAFLTWKVVSAVPAAEIHPMRIAVLASVPAAPDRLIDEILRRQVALIGAMREGTRAEPMIVLGRIVYNSARELF